MSILLTNFPFSIKAVGEEVKRIENVLEKSGAPYTPGRVPDWKL